VRGMEVEGGRREAGGMRRWHRSGFLPPSAFLLRTAHRVEKSPRPELERKVILFVQRTRKFLEIATRALLGLVGRRTRAWSGALE
jgi:hypothetical protein